MRLKALKIFCSESSIHGIPYISNDDIHFVEKIFWAIVTIISFICCLLLIGQILSIVKDDPTVIFSSDNAIPVTNIPFPAVTICFDLLVYGNETHSIYHQIKNKLKSGEITVNDLSEEELKNIQAISLVLSDDFLLSYNISTIPTTDILDRIDQFTLAYQKIDLTFIFSEIIESHVAKIIGRSGFCFNFNMVDAGNLYKNFEEANKFFRYKHDLGSEFRIEKYLRYPMTVKSLNLTNPISLREARSNLEISLSDLTKGRKFTVDELTQIYDFYKFPTPRLYIHNPYEVYGRDSISYNNYPQSGMIFIIDPKQKIIDDNLKDSEPEIRGCYFVADGVEHVKNERNLKYFNFYTKGNCKQECLINRTLEVCGCVQYFMFHDNHTRVCGIHDMKCYKQVENELDNVDLCNCYPYCGEIDYNVKRILRSYIKPIKLLFFFDTYVDLTRPRKHHFFASVKFNSISYFPYVLKRQFTEIDFIAYTGGAFGLFLGISITSFIEIFYYFTMRLMFGWLMSKGYGNKVTNEQNDEGIDTRKSKLSYLIYYFSISTVHGMNQIVMDYRHYVERMFWVLVLGLSLFYCGISSQDMYKRLEQGSIAVTYDSDESSVESIPFPAIYYTPEVLIPTKLVEVDYDLGRSIKDVTRRFDVFKKHDTLFIYMTKSLMCNYRRVLNQIEKLKPSQQFHNYDILFNLYRYSIVDWLTAQSAIWDGKFRPEMVEFLGRSGYGVAFNMMNPEDMFKNGTSLNFTTVLKTAKFDGNDESKYLDLINYQSYPLYAKRLSTLKFTFTKRDSTLYRSICQFAYFNIFSPFEMPKDIEDENSFDFFYGQDLEVQITPEVIKSDEGLRKFSPEKRNCYYEGEKTLKMFKIYTRKNCEMECLADFYFQTNETQCVPYYVLRNVTHPICTVEKHHYVIKSLFDFYQKDYRFKIDGAYVETCGCLDSCNDVQYSIDVIESKIKGVNRDKDNATMTITFRYKNDKFLPLVRRISFTFEDFLCQAGGLLGLYAGISALSVVELLYFVTIRPFLNFYRWGVKKFIKKD